MDGKIFYMCVRVSRRWLLAFWQLMMGGRITNDKVWDVGIFIKKQKAHTQFSLEWPYLQHKNMLLLCNLANAHCANHPLAKCPPPTPVQLNGNLFDLNSSHHPCQWFGRIKTAIGRTFDSWNIKGPSSTKNYIKM